MNKLNFIFSFLTRILLCAEYVDEAILTHSNWEETLLIHPKHTKIIKYPAIKIDCDDCQTLRHLQIKCQNCDQSSFIDYPDQFAIKITGNGASDGNRELKLVAYINDGDGDPIKSMRVLFVDQSCPSILFEDPPQQLSLTQGVRTLLIPYRPTQTDSSKCGNPRFKLVGKCLELAQTDQGLRVTPVCNQLDDEMEGQLLVDFDHLKNGRSVINFSYKISCFPDLKLIGDVAQEYNFGFFDKEIFINLGLWTNVGQCFTPYTQRINLPLGQRQWFHYHQQNQTVHIFGYPENEISAIFEIQATIGDQVVESSAVTINFKRNSNLQQRKLQISTFLDNYSSVSPNDYVKIEATCTAGSNSCQNPAANGGQESYTRDDQAMSGWKQKSDTFSAVWYFYQTWNGLGPRVKTVIGRFTDCVTKSCSVRVGDESTQSLNALCGNPQIGPYFGTYQCDLTGKYVAAQIESQNAQIDEIIHWSFPIIPKSAMQVEPALQNPCLTKYPYDLYSIGDLTTAQDKYFQWGGGCSDIGYEIILNNPFWINEIYLVKRLVGSQNSKSKDIQVTVNGKLCGTLTDQQPTSDFSEKFVIQRLKCTTPIQGNTIVFKILNPTGTNERWHNLAIFYDHTQYQSCGNTIINDQTFSTPLTTTAGSNIVVTQIFSSFIDTIGGANNLCGPKQYTLENYSGTFLTLNQGPTDYSIVLKSLQLTDSTSSPYSINLKICLTYYPAICLIKPLQVTISAGTSCITGNALIVPILQSVVVTFTYTTTYIYAFKDIFSGATSPPTCLNRLCTSDHANVPWVQNLQRFEVKSLGSANVAGTSKVTLKCSLESYPTIPAVQSQFYLQVVAANSDCQVGNSLIVPIIQDTIITRDYITTYHLAFADQYSGISSPPTCGSRTCTSTGSANVLWDDSGQRFTIRSNGALDVAGSYNVILKCQLTNYVSVQGTTSFVVTIPSSQVTTPEINTIPISNCGVNNTMLQPEIQDIIINQVSNTTTVEALRDFVSGSTQPPTCGNRNCSTFGSPNVVWINGTQQFVIQSLGKEDVPGSYVAYLTCSLVNFPSVSSKTVSFKVIVSINCNHANMIVPYLQDIYLDQYSQPTFLPAFQDSVSMDSVPPTCGPRKCSSNNENVVWVNQSQAFQVKYYGSIERQGSFQVNVKCSLIEYPSVQKASAQFKLGLFRFKCPDDKKIMSQINQLALFYLPNLISNQNYQIISKHDFLLGLNSSLLTVFSNNSNHVGMHTIKISLGSQSTSCNFNLFLYFENNAQQKICAGSVDYITGQKKCRGPPQLQISNIDLKGQFSLKFSEKMNILELNSTNLTQRTIQVKKLLNLTLVSTSSFDKKYFGFTWNVTNITSTEISIQVQFYNPAYISREKLYPDVMIVKLLPESQKYFNSNLTGQLIDNPGRKVDLLCPSQIDNTAFAQTVEQLSSIFDSSNKITITLYIIIQLILSFAMDRLWSMENALNLILSLQLINSPSPGNVVMVFSFVKKTAEFNIIPIEEFIAKYIIQTKTQSPGVGFEQAGVSSMRLIPYIAIKWVFMLAGICLYMLLGIISIPGIECDCLKKVKKWLKKQMVYSFLIRFCIQSYFDFCVGCLLSITEPKYVIWGDTLDMILTYLGIIFILGFPILVYFFLDYNENILGEKRMLKKCGSLLESYKINLLEHRRNSKKALTTFLVRRFLLSLNLVLLRNQTIWLQIFFCIQLQLVEQALKLNWQPLTSKTSRYVEAFNDFSVLVMSQITFTFTDLIVRPDWQYNYGWIYIGITALLTAVNICFMAISSSIDLVKFFKYQIFKYKKQKLEKMLKEKQKTQLQQSKKQTLEEWVEIHCVKQLQKPTEETKVEHAHPTQKPKIKQINQNNIISKVTNPQSTFNILMAKNKSALDEYLNRQDINRSFVDVQSNQMSQANKPQKLQFKKWEDELDDQFNLKPKTKQVAFNAEQVLQRIKIVEHQHQQQFNQIRQKQLQNSFQHYNLGIQNRQEIHDTQVEEIKVNFEQFQKFDAESMLSKIEIANEQRYYTRKM